MTRDECAFVEEYRKPLLMYSANTVMEFVRIIDRLRGFIERQGYRRCDIQACNCGSWHKENADPLSPGQRAEMDRLRAVEDRRLRHANDRD